MAIVGVSTVWKAVSDLFPSLGRGSGTGAWAGTYTAEWNGTTRFTSPAGWPAARNTEHATMTVTEAGDDTVVIVWQVQGNPPTGALAFSVKGNTATWAKASPLN